MRRAGEPFGDDEPIADQELAGLFRDLAGVPLLLAVSGGADSMALMHLVADWHATRSPAAAGLALPLVATVDHGLRPESAGEAEFVAGEAARRGLPHATLSWQGDKPASGLQAAARDARYRLLLDHARQVGAGALVLAHTCDDQAETLLMRLARGSGLDGLAAMRPRSQRDGLAIVRPLLGVAKSRLVATLAARGLAWREDPSNQSVAFERVRLRRSAPALAGIGLANAPIARSARRLARAAAALDTLVERTVATGGERIWLDERGFGVVEWNWLLEQPEEIRLRLLGRMLEIVGGQGGPQGGPQGRSQGGSVSLGGLERLTCGRDWRVPVGCSLAGANFRQFDPGASRGGPPPPGDGSRWIAVVREHRRGGLRPQPIIPGGEVVWDGRFRLRLAAACPTGLTVAALGRGWRQVADAEPEPGVAGTPPVAAIETSPAFWRGDVLVAAPLLGHFVAGFSPAWFYSTFVGGQPFAPPRQRRRS